MTKPRDPEALLAAFLAVGMEVLPDRIVDSVLDEVHRTRQRAGFGPWSTRPMSRTRVAAAVVVAVVALGGAFFVIESGLPAIAGPNSTPSVDPSPSLPGVVAPSPTPGATAPNPSAFPRTTGVWVATGTMGTPRSGDEAVRLLDGRVLVVGGSNGDEKDTSAELYDPASGTWSATGNMVRAPAGGFPATLLRDGRVLAGDVDDPTLDDTADMKWGAEVYDPASGTWTATGKTVGGDPGSATLLPDGKVLVVHNGGGSELYDPESGTWTATGTMTRPHQGHTAVLLSDGKVLVAGGYVYDEHGYVTDGIQESVELYEPATGTWTAIANMNAMRNPIAATLLPDGKVLVVGGYSLSKRWPPPDLYDPATGTWTATGDLARPGTHYRWATLLSDGMVLVAGAPNSPDAELYDPATGSWTTTGSMLQDHATATLLLDGTVLVTGGKTGSPELYIPAGVSPPPGLPAIPSPIPTPVPPEADRGFARSVPGDTLSSR